MFFSFQLYKSQSGLRTSSFSTTVTHVTTPARDGKGVLKVMPLAPRHDSNRRNYPVRTREASA